MCRTELKPAGYKDEARPVHNEELGACASDCACGGVISAHAERQITLQSVPGFVSTAPFKDECDPQVEWNRVVEDTPSFNVLDALMRNNSNRSFS